MRLINSCRSTRNNEQLFSIRRRRDVHRSKKRKGQQGKRARSTIKSKVRGRAKKRTKKKTKKLARHTKLLVTIRNHGALRQHIRFASAAHKALRPSFSQCCFATVVSLTRPVGCKAKKQPPSKAIIRHLASNGRGRGRARRK